MKLVTWNVNHRAKPRLISHLVSDVIDALAPDVLVLTEYVVGPSHDGFTQSLASTGLTCFRLSQYDPDQNRVLIASRSRIVEGAICAPPIAPAVPSNFLHVALPCIGAEIAGLRLPDYSKEPLVRRQCWDWLGQMAATVCDKPFVILGDLNSDPTYSKARCGDRFERFVRAGWQHALPEQGASYWKASGDGVRLDHAFVSRYFRVTATRYVPEINGITAAHPGRQSLPDHAPLLVELERDEAGR